MTKMWLINIQTGEVKEVENLPANMPQQYLTHVVSDSLEDAYWQLLRYRADRAIALKKLTDQAYQDGADALNNAETHLGQEVADRLLAKVEDYINDMQEDEEDPPKLH